MLPGVYLTDFPSAYRDFGGDEAKATEMALEELHRLTSTEIPPSSVAAMLIEPIQGEGGYTPAPPAFLRELRDFCDRHGILLIVDEVQTGFGRTGQMWAFEHAGIVPDVVCMAKAIANGLPLSAIISSRELQEAWGRGAHGSTYGGNPVACAAGPGRARDHPGGRPGGQRGGPRRGADDRPRRRSRPRTTGSATSAGAA